MKMVKVSNERILLSNVGGKIYATQNDCGHQRASLSRGTLDGNIVTCPLHGAKFDVRTGAVLGPPAQRGVKSYAVKVTGREIEIEV